MYGAERALSEYDKKVYEKCQLLDKASLSYDVLYNFYFSTKDIESDKDANGNTVSGSKRNKVVSAINGLNVSAEQKLLLIASKGYSLTDAEKNKLLKYILNLKGTTKEEKAALAEMCGFDVQNGKIVTNQLKSTLKLRLN